MDDEPSFGTERDLPPGPINWNLLDAPTAAIEWRDLDAFVAWLKNTFGRGSCRRTGTATTS